MEKTVPNPGKRTALEWELINPEGVKQPELVKLNPPPASLEGKTVVLSWNNKPNGEIFLNRLAELITRDVKGVKIIKLWELEPFTAVVSHAPKLSQQIAATALEYKPDIVINAQCD